jgi:hypothetical protein
MLTGGKQTELKSLQKEYRALLNSVLPTSVGGSKEANDSSENLPKVEALLQTYSLW